MRVRFETVHDKVENLKVGDRVLFNNFDSFTSSTVLGLDYGPQPGYLSLTLSDDGMPQYLPAGSHVLRIVELWMGS